ncbi:thiamine pyrophosphate-binding protein [Gordonia sp. CPCC 205515]|uniref:thiamine pyrophosphate-binding protein n=1 Tax=Gordonia sp. CPCC 205515 TaxID=3140791 RepID=UPI003AF3F391
MTITLSGKRHARPASPHATNTTSVSEYVVAQLVSIGIEVVYGVHGANVEDLYDAAVRAESLTPVVAKHEFAAGAMADGVARITGRPAAVMTTSGGGAMNVVPALAEAYDSRVPVLALIGTAPTALVGCGAFQDMLSPPDTIDIAGLLSSVVGSCSVVSHADDVPAALATAFVTLHRGLPAAVLLPKDIQSAELGDPHLVAHANAFEEATAEVHSGMRRIADELCETVRSGGRVCFWVGEEASIARVGAGVDRLANAVGATVVASPGGRDILSHNTYSAGVTGVMGHPSAHRALADADLCLVLGCRMTMTDRAGLEDVLRDRRVHHVGTEPPRAPGLAEHVPVTDLSDSITWLVEYVYQQGLSPAQHSLPRVEYLPVAPSAVPLDLRAAIDEIGAVLPAGTAVFADAGNAGAAAIHYLPWGSGRFVVALGMGGMGYGIAAGVGNAIRTAARGDPGRTVVVAGDGSFFMHGMELHTAVEHQAPVTVVILNNNAHGMCVTREHLFFPNTPSVNRFAYSDIAAGLAAMFDGLTVAHAADRATLRRAARDLMTVPGPACLVVDVDPDEVPPFAPFLPKGTS